MALANSLKQHLEGFRHHFAKADQLRYGIQCRNTQTFLQGIAEWLEPDPVILSALDAVSRVNAALFNFMNSDLAFIDKAQLDLIREEGEAAVAVLERALAAAKFTEEAQFLGYDA